MKEKTIVYIHSFQTSVGEFRSASSSKGVAVISLPNERKKEFEMKVSKIFPNKEIKTGGKNNTEVEKQIKAYLSGRLTKFTVDIDLHASPFYRKSLQYVKKIPFGKTKTYGEIAKAIGNPKASRAVGTANACNNLPIIIPCHRVLASNGLGGYGGGLPLKKKLLKIEGIEF